MDYEETYTVLLKAGAFSDLSGNANKKDLQYTFTTHYGFSPRVTEFSPAMSERRAPGDEPIIITYTKDIFPGVNFNNVSVSGGTEYPYTPIPVNVSINKNKITIEPVSGKWGKQMYCYKETYNKRVVNIKLEVYSGLLFNIVPTGQAI